MTTPKNTDLPPQLAEINPPFQLKMSKILSYIMYVWIIIGVSALSLRVFLLAFSANTTTPFVSFILRVSDDYLRPFNGIFPARQIGETGYFDVAALFAIFIYLMVAWGVDTLIKYIQSKIDQNEREQRRILYYEQNEDKVSPTSSKKA